MAYSHTIFVFLLPFRTKKNLFSKQSSWSHSADREPADLTRDNLFFIKRVQYLNLMLSFNETLAVLDQKELRLFDHDAFIHQHVSLGEPFALEEF